MRYDNLFIGMEKIKNQNQTKSRPPIAVVLGHVDHGKSSLLEAIKNFKITEKESGGITQHIGAYEVEVKDRKITFIDTPGHEAFFTMRERGAKVADIALLVVDASQSVQTQTKEALHAIKKAGIPMIVVINKIDLPQADPERIKRDLSKIDVLVESMGGTIPAVNVSAKEKTGIEELLDVILLVADMSEFVADSSSEAEGFIIESFMHGLQGPIANAITLKGILKTKDIISTDSAYAKIKSLKNFLGQEIQEAQASQPVIILGFDKVPSVGEKFKIRKSVKEAEEKIKSKEVKAKGNTRVIETDATKKIFNIVLKGDVGGSLEAIEAMLKNIPQEKVILRILKSEVGDISETDVKLAKMAKAEILGFRVKINSSASKFLKNEKEKDVRIKTFDIIYELIQETRKDIEKTLLSEVVKKQVGKLKTILVFFSEKNRQIVGGKITEGELRRGLKLEVFRSAEKIGHGKIVNLQRDKKDIDKLSKGSEAGILFEGNVKIEPGDILEAYVEEMKKDTL